jgi:predicted transcriptional regulator
MTSVTLNLQDDLLERAAKAAKEEGISLEKMLARLVEDALEEEYELDAEEEAAVAEGIADMKAGRWVSHEEMMRMLKEQRGR